MSSWHMTFGIVNKAEIDVFLELPCFFDDPANVGNFTTNKLHVHVFERPMLSFHLDKILRAALC